MQKTKQVMLGLFVVPFALTGCFAGPNTKASSPIDPPQGDAQIVQAPAKEKKQEASGHLTEIYMLNQDGYVMPYSLRLPGKSLAKSALECLVVDSPTVSQLPKGSKGLLPKGTKVLGVSIKDGVATANFSKQFLSYNVADEEKIVDAITWTLTGFDRISKVDIQVEGKPLAVMPKSKTVVQQRSREDGINVEVANGVDISASMPVTLFFLSQAEDDTISYVPVTRLVNRADNIGETVIKELIRGPLESSNLIGPLDAATTIKAVKVKGKEITANFGKEILQ
jgi:germination protein M